MDFIERIFHLSPDHGDGSFEAMLVFALLFLVALALLRFRHRTRRPKPMLLGQSLRARTVHPPPTAEPAESARTG
jgi:hypothetical protein